MSHDKAGLKCLLKVSCELQFLKLVGRVFHSLGPDSEGVFPNVLLGAGNQQLARRAVRAEQPSLVLHKQAF